MTLVRWDPFRELEDMSDRLNRVFARPATRTSGGKEQLTVADWVPTVDISETDSEYLIKAEKEPLPSGPINVEGALVEQRCGVDNLD